MSELPHIEAKDGDVHIDGVSYTPSEASAIADSIFVAAFLADEYRSTATQVICSAAIGHGRELPAHDSGRDDRPVEEQE